MNYLMTSLPKVLGEKRLVRIGRVKVGIAGTGGLGSNVAAHLVRSGFRSLVLADFDKVEASNLNRQFYFADQVGKFKVDALAENLKRINPDLELSLFRERLKRENMGDILGLCDIWVEAFDDPSMKKLCVETALQLNKKVVSASGLAGWGNTDEILTKVFSPNFIVVGDLKKGVDIDNPPMSMRVGVAAAKEADVVLSWVLGEESGQCG